MEEVLEHTGGVGVTFEEKPLWLLLFLYKFVMAVYVRHDTVVFIEMSINFWLWNWYFIMYRKDEKV